MQNKNGRCGDCRYYLDVADGKGQCRRYAPRSEPIMLFEIAIALVEARNFTVEEYGKNWTRLEDVQGNAVWPVTLKINWCGEFESLPK